MVTLESLVISLLIILLLLALIVLLGGGVFLFTRWNKVKKELETVKEDAASKERELDSKLTKLTKERDDLLERVEEVETHVFATDEDDEPLNVDVVGLKLYNHVEDLGVMGQHDNVYAILCALVTNPTTIRIVPLADGRVCGWIGSYTNPPRPVKSMIQKVGEMDAQPVWKGK